jgi:hypothetical protein
MSRRRIKDWLAIMNIPVAVVLAFRSELKPIVIDWWSGLTPWRFMLVVSLLGFAAWGLDRLIQWWRHQENRISELEESVKSADLAIRVIAEKLDGAEDKFEKALKGVKDALASEAGTARLEASNLSRLLDGMREDYARRMEGLNRKLDTMLQAVPPTPTPDSSTRPPLQE